MENKVSARLFSNATATYKWTVTLSTGLFMFLALYVYRAYHIDAVPALTGHSMLFRALTHSAIISIIFYVLEFHLSRYLNLSQKIKPLATASIATFTGLNITFLAFNYFYHWTQLSWASYLQFLYEYPLVVAIPVALSLLIAPNRPATLPDDIIVIVSENQKEKFQLKAENLLFIKSADNYVEIFHLSMNKINKHLLRKSLKHIEEEHALSPFLLRCHRSYMINPDNVDHINRLNGRVDLSISGVRIPVSKRYLQNLFERFPTLFTPHS